MIQSGSRGWRTVARSAVPPIRDRAFWIIQAGVAVGAVGHALIEFLDLHAAGIWSELAGLTTFLYVLPISFAVFRYGLRGGVWTALEVVLVTSPNIALSHPEDFGACQPW